MRRPTIARQSTSTDLIRRTCIVYVVENFLKNVEILGKSEKTETKGKDTNGMGGEV